MEIKRKKKTEQNITHKTRTEREKEKKNTMRRSYIDYENNDYYEYIIDMYVLLNIMNM